MNRIGRGERFKRHLQVRFGPTINDSDDTARAYVCLARCLVSSCVRVKRGPRPSNLLLRLCWRSDPPADTQRIKQRFAERVGRTLEQHSILMCLRSEEHTSELQSRQYLVCRL